MKNGKGKGGNDLDGQPNAMARQDRAEKGMAIQDMAGNARHGQGNNGQEMT